jgi:serine/threonine-protein kinase
MKRLLELLRPSLLGRVALALVLVGLLPVGLLAYRLVGINRDAMVEQVELTHTRAAATIAKRISAELATFLSLANGLAANPAFADPRSATAQDLLRYNLGAWSRLGVLGIAVVTPQGEQVILAQLPEEESKRRVRQTVHLPPRDLVEVSLQPPPRGRAGKAVGDENVVVTLRLAAPLPEQRGFIWLVADGSVIRDAVVAPEQLGKEAAVTLARRDGDAMLGSLDPYPPDVLELAFNPNVEGVESGFLTAAGTVVGAFSAVTHANWTVLSHQRVEVAHAVANDMERESWRAVILVAIGIVLISAVAYSTTVRPIRQLAAAQRRLAGVTGTTSGGEIEQLRASFDALEERLKDRTALDEVFLGRYQVRDVIGSGAMGTVFLGYDPKLQRPIALKTIRLDQQMAADKRQNLMSRLLQEAVTTAKFSHPNIVAIYDVEDRGGSAFMAMEYVDGDSLENLIWRKGKLSVDETVVLGAAIARALAAAHSHDLVHRDVKPANILLGLDGSIKVTDFGIAELLSSMSEQEDVVFGTPGYLPPETLQGKGYDASGDLFSLGSILYLCLTGTRPFEGKTVKEIIKKTLFSTAIPLSRLVNDVRPDLDALILSLLSSDRSRRPNDATAVAERLDRMVASSGAKWSAPVSYLQREQRETAAPAASYLPTTKLRAG